MTQAPHGESPPTTDRASRWRLLDAMPDGVVVVSDTGEIVFANRHAGDLFEYKADELIGMSVDHLLPDDRRQVHRAHRTRYRAAPVTRPMGAGVLLEAQRSDGSRVPVEISLSPLRDGDADLVVASVRDVTARVATESHLHRVLGALDASDDGLFMFDAETLRYCYASAGASRLVGYEPEELLSMTPMHLNPNGSERYYRELIATLERSPDETVLRQKLLMRKDGSEVPVETTYKWAGVGTDQARWAVALVRDISPRVEAQAQLDASEAARQAVERVLAITEDRERIARDLHDTVIQRVFGVGLRLQGTTRFLPSDADAAAERIDEAIDELDLVVKQVRSVIFALGRDGRTDTGSCRARLLDIAHDAGRVLGFEPAMLLDGPIDSRLDRAVCDDLQAVLTEALSNVARHANAHHVDVHVVVADDLALRVEDDGVGPPANDAPRGNGLDNLERRAAAHLGTFTLTPRPGGGTIAEWRVPLATPAS